MEAVVRPKAGDLIRLINEDADLMHQPHLFVPNGRSYRIGSKDVLLVICRDVNPALVVATWNHHVGLVLTEYFKHV